MSDEYDPIMSKCDLYVILKKLLKEAKMKEWEEKYPTTQSKINWLHKQRKIDNKRV